MWYKLSQNNLVLIDILWRNAPTKNMVIPDTQLNILLGM